MKTINKKDNFKDKRLNKRKFFSPFAFLFVLTLSIIFQTPNLFANSLGGPFVQGYLLGASMALKALLKQEVIYPGYTYRTDARSFYLRAVKMRIFEEQIRNMIHQHKDTDPGVALLSLSIGNVNRQLDVAQNVSAWDNYSGYTTTWKRTQRYGHSHYLIWDDRLEYQTTYLQYAINELTKIANTLQVPLDATLPQEAITGFIFSLDLIKEMLTEFYYAGSEDGELKSQSYKTRQLFARGIASEFRKLAHQLPSGLAQSLTAWSDKMDSFDPMRANPWPSNAHIAVQTQHDYFVSDFPNPMSLMLINNACTASLTTNGGSQKGEK